MNRKALLLAIMTTATVLTGCGKKIAPAESSYPEDYDALYDQFPELRNGQDARLVLEDGRSQIVTDDGSIITETEDGMVWNYLGGTCMITFPLDWDNHFLVRGTSVYCKATYEYEEKSGELFTLQFVKEDTIADLPESTALVGGVRSKYTVAVIPTELNYNAADPDLKEEYENLAAQVPDILKTATCFETKGFQPIDLSAYMRPSEAEESKLFGAWTEGNGAEDEDQPFVEFQQSTGSFVYKSGESTLKSGKFLVNRNAADYEWNTENWGDAGLAFADGQVYRVTYYETEPPTIEFEGLYPNKVVMGDTLNGKSMTIKN